MLDWTESKYDNTFYKAVSCKSYYNILIHENVNEWVIEKLLYQDMIRFSAKFNDLHDYLFKGKFEDLETAKSWCQNLENAFQQSIKESPILSGWV